MPFDWSRFDYLYTTEIKPDCYFQKGNKVVVKEDFSDSVNAGDTGIIIGIPQTCIYSDPKFFNVKLDKNNKVEKIKIEYIEKLEKVKDIAVVKCSKCQKKIIKGVAKCSDVEEYYCESCSEIQKYSKKNGKKLNVKSKESITFGLELECIPKSEKSYASMLKDEYALIPTHDGSLPENGVEFKTPIHGDLSVLESHFRDFEKYVNFSNPRCGQHINVGCRAYLTKKNMDVVKKYSDILIEELTKYCMANRKSTRKIFGRDFNVYALPFVKPTKHKSWISFRNNNRIEFRLAKFVNHEQYFNLIRMCKDITICIIDNFVKEINSENVEDEKIMLKNAQNTSYKLVEIFQTYEK